MLKTGVSLGGIEAFREENYKKIGESGLSAVEISRGEYSDEFDYNQIARWARQYGVELWSHHLPFYPHDVVSVCATDKSVKAGTIEKYSELIKRGADIGFDKFILHGSCDEGAGIIGREDNIKSALDTLNTLVEVAKAEGAQIAIENLLRLCLGNTLEEFEILLGAHNDLKVCFDINHCPVERNLEFVQKFGEKIITLHVSDCFKDKLDQHLLCGEGDVDWSTLYQALIDKGYRGVWMYECYLSKHREKPLEFEELHQNALKIFEGKI